MTTHDCLASGCSDRATRAHQSAQAQGLPAYVEDATVLGRVADIFNASTSARTTSTSGSPRTDGQVARGGSEPSGATSDLPDPIPSTPERRRAASTVNASAHQSSESDSAPVRTRRAV